MSQDRFTNVNSPFELPLKEKEILLQNFPRGIVALDFETTGLSPLCDKIIEIAAIKITPEGIFYFETLINPKTPIGEETTAIHGITNEMVQNEPTIDEVLPSFIQFLGHLPLVAHNAKFDIGFLVFNMHEEKISPQNNKVFCSCQFARKVYPEIPNHKLSTLAQHLEISLKHHEAFDDAAASLRILSKSLLLLENSSFKEEALKEATLFFLEDFKKNNEWELPSHLDLLKESVHEQKIIEMIYKGGSHKGIFRPIRPIGILPLPTGAVLYAHCLLSNTYKSFGLKKIKLLRIPSFSDLQKWQTAYEQFKILDKRRQEEKNFQKS